MNKLQCVRWAVDLSNFIPSLENLVVAVSSIQPEEKTRLMKFVFLNDFLSSLVGRLIMRKFVNDSTSIPYNQIHFNRDIRGKPYLVNQDEKHTVSFNVSHQGSLVIFAGIIFQASSQDHEPEDFGVGCDIIKIEYSGGRSLCDFFNLMRKKFSDDEWRYINRREDDNDKLKSFMRLWCLKESYVKEVGVGITIDLKNISFSVNPEEDLNSEPITSTTLKVNGKPMMNWNFEEHHWNEKYCAAIAFKNCKPEIGTFKIMKFEDILVRAETQFTSPDIFQYCEKVLEKPMK